MSNIISKNLLAKIENEYIVRNSFGYLSEKYEKRSIRAALSSEVTVFLSHKHDEKKLVKQAVALFESLGVSVYIDWLDSSMPPTTSEATATKLKRKIVSCRKFVLLASDRAIESKWCNWELGLGDAEKYIEHIALLPAAEGNQPWKGNEYLGIYPVITSEYQFTSGNYYVEFKQSKIKLQDWLRK